MDCELLIIGGGVAGQVAALSANQHGIEDVKIIEKSDKIGGNISQKIDLCTTDNYIDSIIKDLDLSINHISNNSKWFSPSGLNFDFTSRVSDLWFKRGPLKDSFDVTTAKKLKNRGIEILLNHRATKIKRENDYVQIQIKNGKDIKNIKSKAIIFSDGINSLYWDKQNYYSILASGCYGKNFDIEKGIPHIFFDNQDAYGSYIFLVKDPKDEIGYIINGYLQKEEKINPKNKLAEIRKKNKFINNTLKNAEIKGEISGLLYTAKPLDKIGFKRILLTGDSAHLMDPLFHYGLKQAIISGYYSGKILSGFLNNHHDYLSEYNDFYLQYFKQKLDEAHYFRKIYNKLNNNDIDTLFHMLDNLKQSNVDFDDLFDHPRNNLKTIIKTIITNPRCIGFIPKIVSSLK